MLVKNFSKAELTAITILFVGIICWLAMPHIAWVKVWPQNLTLPITQWISFIVEQSVTVVKPLGRIIALVLNSIMEFVQLILLNVPFLLIIGVVASIAWKIGGAKMLALVTIGLSFIVASGYWIESMNTLSLVLISVPFALTLGGLVGIASHEFPRVKKIVLPTLDVMQTIPTFAYLTPLLIFFGFGPVVGLIASIIYASPPMTRNVILGLERINPEVVDAAFMEGSNRLQRLAFVQLPAATPQIMVGVNQCIMAALSMVIIAAVIGGFNDIGWEVLLTMRKAQFGPALLAGLVIVIFAILLDRLSGALATPRPKYSNKIFLAIIISTALITLLANPYIPASNEFALFKTLFDNIDANLGTFTAEHGTTLEAIKNNSLFFFLLPLRIGLDDAVLPFTWGFQWTPFLTLALFTTTFFISAVLVWYKRIIAAALLFIIVGIIQTGIAQLPWPFVIFATTALSFSVADRKLAIMSFSFLTFILLSGLWEKAMLSIYLCTAAVIICTILGALIGLACSLSPTLWRIIQPICDILQTIPLFVFLIPVIMFFQIGEFSALLAIIAYAIVPTIRYTHHGLTTTPHELIEAAIANGATPTQIITNIKIPHAIPIILLGINQTILFSFTMLVITALIGTTGLGQSIYLALGQADVGLGITSGAAMALLAIISDRLACQPRLDSTRGR